MEDSNTVGRLAEIVVGPGPVSEIVEGLASPSTTEQESSLQSRAGNEESKVLIRVLNRAEAELNIESAVSCLRDMGFNFNNQENLRAALMPDFNRELALVGDSAQRLILTNQWHKMGGMTRDFWQKHIFGNVGTNAHQRRMAITHGLNDFIFIVADSPEHQQLQSISPRYELFPHKVLADTMEALMGAIQLDGNDHWTEDLERFMRVFELDLDAALRYPMD